MLLKRLHFKLCIKQIKVLLIKTRKSIAWDNRYAVPVSFCHEMSQMMLHMIARILSFD